MSSRRIDWRTRKRGTDAQIGTKFPLSTADKRALPSPSNLRPVTQTIGTVVYEPKHIKPEQKNEIVEFLREHYTMWKVNRQLKDIDKLVKEIEESKTDFSRIMATRKLKRKHPEAFQILMDIQEVREREEEVYLSG